MARYSVELNDVAKEEFLAIPFPFRRQVNQRIQKLKADPYLLGSDPIGDTGFHRLDVAGWRVIYEIDDENTRVTIAGFRRIEAAS